MHQSHARLTFGVNHRISRTPVARISQLFTCANNSCLSCRRFGYEHDTNLCVMLRVSRMSRQHQIILSCQSCECASNCIELNDIGHVCMFNASVSHANIVESKIFTKIYRVYAKMHLEIKIY